MRDNSKLLFFLSLLWASVILALGLWWLYLIVNLSEKLGPLVASHPELMGGSDIMRMVKWEGGSFLVLLFLLSGGLFFLYLKDQTKTKALQAFFASLTHELKTPLASIRLQAEVLHDLLIQSSDKLLLEASERMIEDTGKLEHQMDKILQLSRIERGGRLSARPVDLPQFIEATIKNWNEEIKLSLHLKGTIAPILADEFALKLIIRNLIENTKKHTTQNWAQITLQQLSPDWVQMRYEDQGSFAGDYKKLGSLFYKFRSPKGSGIGLYLCKRLVQAMGGQMQILPPSLSPQGFIVEFIFKTVNKN